MEHKLKNIHQESERIDCLYFDLKERTLRESGDYTNCFIVIL